MLRSCLLISLLLMPMGCSGERAASANQETATIAPETPRQNTSTNDDDSVQTATTEIGEERSPNEGAGMTESETTTTSAPPPGK